MIKNNKLCSREATYKNKTVILYTLQKKRNTRNQIAGTSTETQESFYVQKMAPVLKNIVCYSIVQNRFSKICAH